MTQPAGEWCERCQAYTRVEIVDAWDDGTDEPPQRPACVECGAPPGHVALL